MPYTDVSHIPDVLVHITQKKYVANILKEGLHPNKPRNSTGGNVEGRVYFALDADVLTDDTMDAASYTGPDAVVLHVDVTQIKARLRPDPEWRSYDNDEPCHRPDDLCWYLEGSVPAQLIKIR